MSDKEKQDYVNKLTQSRNNRSEEEKQKSIEKFKYTMENKTSEEKILRSKKLSDSIRASHDIQVKHQKEALSKRTPEEWAVIKAKEAKTKKDKLAAMSELEREQWYRKMSEAHAGANNGSAQRIINITTGDIYNYKREAYNAQVISR